ncbi:MAG: DUF3859 domain-containing protein [Rhodobiaceae bacterium]|nr:DUF3859 domain-containing protein [Rhodobiaceae bacterium]MCC0057434.1 DUF3859 domain-containing protein [Rhodobiaceae bacterium]
MLKCLVAALLLVGAASAARAEDARVDRIDIVDTGIYTVVAGAETANKDAPTGVIKSPDSFNLTERTTTIAGRVGLEFGLRYVAVGAPEGVEVPLDIVLTFPPEGLPDPTEKTPIHKTEFSRTKKIGETVYLGYGFENNWEIVPGTWTFEIFHKGQKLAEQRFTVTR